MREVGSAYQRGVILYQQGRYALALEEFRKELAHVPNSPPALAMSALSLAHGGQHDAAETVAGTAIAADPTYAFAHYALSRIIVLRPCRGKSRSFRLLRDDPRTRQVKQLKRSKGPISEAIRLDPLNADYLRQSAAIELDLQNYKEALKVAERGLEAQPDHVNCADIRARALRALGDLEESHRTLGRALNVNPEHAATHSNQGWNLIYMGDPKGAFEHFTEALRLNPNDAGAKRGLTLARRARNVFLRPIMLTPFWTVRRFGRRTLAYVAVLIGIGVGVMRAANQSSTDDLPSQMPIDMQFPRTPPAPHDYPWPALIVIGLMIGLVLLIGATTRAERRRKRLPAKKANPPPVNLG